MAIRPQDPTRKHTGRHRLAHRTAPAFLALPVACLMLAMVGIPLGTSTRKGGQSAGYIWAIFLAFFCYYLGYITLTGLARAHSIGVEMASWLPNAAFGLAGIVMIARMEIPGDRDLLGSIRQIVTRWSSAIHFSSLSRVSRRDSYRAGWMKLAVFQILDSYVLSNFLFYFFVTLACFVTMTQVFTFFDLLGDIVKNNVPMSHVVKYHVFLTPELIYDTLPIAVLVSIPGDVPGTS